MNNKRLPIIITAVGAIMAFVFYISGMMYRSNLKGFYSFSPPYSNDYERNAANTMMLLKIASYFGILIFAIGLIWIIYKIYLNSIENKKQ